MMKNYRIKKYLKTGVELKLFDKLEFWKLEFQKFIWKFESRKLHLKKIGILKNIWKWEFLK